MSSQKQIKISIVLPCRNEEKTISGLVKRLVKKSYEVIVVDNGSTDSTVLRAREAGAIVIKEARVDQRGIGYGFAHLRGLKKATGDYIVGMDGDGTYPYQEIPQIVRQMQAKQIDFMTCSRFPLQNEKAVSPLRRLGIWVLNFEVAILYGYPMKDILSGMWVMNRQAVKKLKLVEGGWDFSPEIKIKALRHPHLKFAEYHISHSERAGESKQRIWQTGFGHLWYILKLRFSSLVFFRHNHVSKSKNLKLETGHKSLLKV